MHRELSVQAAERAVADIDVDGARLDDELPGVVGIEADVARPQRERNGLGLAWRQRDPLESVESPYRLQDSRPVLADVELDNVVS
jgi:hypothetical protein